MNSKPMLFECLNCKETYLADNLCDGYKCPKCNGHITERGFIKELEESVKDMQDKINRAKENGLIRKYYQSNKGFGSKPEPYPVERINESWGHVNYVCGVDLSDKKDHTSHTININVNAENIDKEKLIEEIINNLNNPKGPKRSGVIV